MMVTLYKKQRFSGVLIKQKRARSKCEPIKSHCKSASAYSSFKDVDEKAAMPILWVDLFIVQAPITVVIDSLHT